MSAHDGVMLYRTTDRMEAAMVELELARLGVPFVNSSGDGAPAMGLLPAGHEYVEIWVPQARLEEARDAIADLRESRLEREPDSPGD